MGQTVVEKIAERHLSGERPGRPLRAGDLVFVRPRHVLTHDNTAPVIERFRAMGATTIHDPSQPVFVLDHDIQNTSRENLAKYAAIESFAREQGVAFFPAGSGIGHQVMVEQLYVVPGALIVAADSHANMYGAAGALGTPVVRSDAAAIWARGTFWWQLPPTIQVRLEGRLPAGATGKDVILALCGLYGSGEVFNAAVEFSGSGVTGLSMDDRLTIANMTTEWGPVAGWFPVDEITLAFLERRRRVLAAAGIERIDAATVRSWARHPVRPDADAVYAGRIDLDLASVQTHVAGPDSVTATTQMAEIQARRIAIHKAYLVSCANSRLADLQAAAAVLAGRRVAPGVELYIAAASHEVQQDAEACGAWQTLLAAGAKPLPPGCGPCIGLGVGLLAPGEVGISATNRNFKGRMGSRDAHCYLASPAVVAASAAAGFICGPHEAATSRLPYSFTAVERQQPETPRAPLLPGFPETLHGRLVFLPRDAIDTDGIYGKEYTYRDAMPAAAMAEVVLRNYDPAFAGRARAGDILVGARDFGIGSSREQAVTALQAAGIALIIAGGFSRTYLRNALNNGFLCLVCPELSSRMHELTRESVEAGERTIVPGDDVEVDFAAGRIRYRREAFLFRPPDRLAQELIVAGGIAGAIRRRI